MNRLSRELAEEVIAFLDRQSDHLQVLLALLDGLRESLIRRDLPAMQEMQAQLGQEGQRRAELDRSRQALQETLAESLGCAGEAVCLSLAGSRADADLREKIEVRRQALRGQVARLRQQHLATELLVRECARMNRRLLEAVMGTGEKTETYDARGRRAWSAGTGLMNLKL